MSKKLYREETSQLVVRLEVGVARIRIIVVHIVETLIVAMNVQRGPSAT